VNAINVHQSTPLHEAAQFAHLDVVECLLRNGADPTITNKYKT
jgi:ankyrin repeat protein